jgi:predicted P-loop ATPase
VSTGTVDGATLRAAVSPFDSDTERHLEKQVDDLAAEFGAHFRRDAVARVVREAAEEYADSPVKDFVPILAYRASRERLRTMAGLESALEAEG